MVADEDGRVVAPLRVRRRPAPPEGRLIHDVVVDEGRGVEKFEIGRASCREECRSRLSPYH